MTNWIYDTLIVTLTIHKATIIFILKWRTRPAPACVPDLVGG